MSKPWQFIRWYPGPTIPRVDVKPLSAPIAEPQAAPGSCPQCRGTGRGSGSDEYGWHKCGGCNGSGKSAAEPQAEPATWAVAERCWLCLGKGDQGEGSAPGSCPCCHGAGKVGGQP